MIFDQRCMKRRRVDSCGKCCRFVNCRDNKKVDFNPYACARLGYAIVGSITEEYAIAYSKGKRNICNKLEKIIRNERTLLLTNEEYDGEAIADALIIKCRKEYGDIDDIWRAKEKSARKKISALKLKMKETEDIKDKHRILAKISAIKGELNE